MPKPRCSYQLHVQLCDTKPAVWRRLVVSDTTTLAALHRILETAMGWTAPARYAFDIAGQRYGIPDADTPDDPTMDARRYPIGQLLQGQALPVRYLRGEGGVWLHRIKLEAATPLATPDLLHSLPICLGGRNACPPPGCASPAAYAQALQAAADRQHPHHRAAVRALGAAFDAKAFAMCEAQARVRALTPPAPRPLHAPGLAPAAAPLPRAARALERSL